LLIYGDEKSGKTTLLYQTFKHLKNEGSIPIYLRASDINSAHKSEVEKKINQAIARIYENQDRVRQAKKNQKILLVDDIDRLIRYPNQINELLDYSQSHFGRLILTADQAFEISELLSDESSQVLRNLESYELTRFGYKLRHRLVKKWGYASGITTKSELDHLTHSVEEIFNSVLGKNLVPSYPIFLLILLQSHEKQQQSLIQNSGLASYYQYLIAKSLGEAGVKAQDLDEYYNFLSNFSWMLNGKGAKEVIIEEFRLFNERYSQQYFRFDLDSRLDFLQKAKIISFRNGAYTFTYPYIYYFFFGRYLSQNFDEPEIQNLIQTMCSSLYKRDHAHAVLFFAHHSNSYWIISRISSVLDGCFSEFKEATFSDDVTLVNALTEHAAQLFLNPIDVEENQIKRREQKDKIEFRNSDFDEDCERKNDPLFSFNLSIRTAEILGQILKNSYGSLKRPQKLELVTKIFNSPLRFYRALLEKFSENPDQIVNLIANIIKGQNEGPSTEAHKRQAQKIVFNIFGLLATGLILRTAECVSSDKLMDDISTAMEENRTNAYLILGFATRLIRPGNLPIARLKAFSDELKLKNSFAHNLLQSLGAYHLHQFHLREDDRQRLADALNISVAAGKKIESQAQKTRLLRNK
jgi:hypothetical protein